MVDGNACPEGYEVELTPDECTGMFRKFHDFLDARFAANDAFGFSRVFVPGRGKIRPEGWHIAHLPTSRRLLEGFSLEVLRSIDEKSDIACKDDDIRALGVKSLKVAVQIGCGHYLHRDAPFVTFFT